MRAAARWPSAMSDSATRRRSEHEQGKHLAGGDHRNARRRDRRADPADDRRAGDEPQPVLLHTVVDPGRRGHDPDLLPVGGSQPVQAGRGGRAHGAAHRRARVRRSRGLSVARRRAGVLQRGRRGARGGPAHARGDRAVLLRGREPGRHVQPVGRRRTPGDGLGARRPLGSGGDRDRRIRPCGGVRAAPRRRPRDGLPHRPRPHPLHQRRQSAHVAGGGRPGRAAAAAPP